MYEIWVSRKVHTPEESAIKLKLTKLKSTVFKNECQSLVSLVRALS